MFAPRRWIILVAVLAVVSLGAIGCADDPEEEPIVDAGNGDVAEDVAQDAPDDAEDAPTDAEPDTQQDADQDADAQQDADQDADAQQDADQDAAPDAPPALQVSEVDCDTVTPDEEVSMLNIAYNPNTLTIAEGDVVQWTNDEDAVLHTVTSGRSGDAVTGDLFDSGNLSPGDTYCLQFEAPGDYQYFCAIHPQQMNDGLVTVE